MKLIKTRKIIVFIAMCTICLYAHANYHAKKSLILKLVDTAKTKRLNELKDSIILDFSFRDTSNRPVRISDFRGNFVFIDLWYSGCGECIVANKALRIVHEKLKNENILFLSISVDSCKEKWIESITNNAKATKIDPWAGRYYPAPGTVILNTGSSGYNNEFIKKYNPENGYPKLMFVDPSGKLISDHPPRPDYSGEDKPQELIDFLLSYLKKHN